MMVTDHVAGRLSELDKQIVAAVPPGGNWRDLPLDFPSKRIAQIRVGAASGGGSRSTYYGRLQWHRPSYTINTYINRPGNGCFIHPEANRLITVREAARLQTFPDSIRFEGTTRPRCVQVGNAVPPLLAYQLGLIMPLGTVVDLFAGAGGMGFGLALAGHRMVLSADNDGDACKTLGNYVDERHSVARADLSREVELDALVEQARGLATDLDLVVGGPPCQGFSTAGPCRVDDDRNRLVLAFLRFVEQTRPGRVLLENVPALRWRGAALLEEVCERLSRLGYITDVVILHAEAYGVPQLRRRLFVQGTLNGVPCWPMPTHPLVDPAFPGDQPGSSGALHTATVRDAIDDLPASVAANPDSPVPYATPARSALQQWARADLDIGNLLPAATLVEGWDELQTRLPFVHDH
jgi:DNA (cytosine-5)-methyltransferase 1